MTLIPTATYVVCYLMGPTCTGKSTFINYVKQQNDDTVGFIEVGKMLREKYPPEYFEGQMAPEKTAKEALELFAGQLREMLDHKEVILVDGQPRSTQQAIVTNSWSDNLWYSKGIKTCYAYLWSPIEVRQARIALRFDRSRVKESELAQQRLVNDVIGYHEILGFIQTRGYTVAHIATDEPMDVWVPKFYSWLKTRKLEHAPTNVSSSRDPLN